MSTKNVKIKLNANRQTTCFEKESPQILPSALCVQFHMSANFGYFC